MMTIPMFLADVESEEVLATWRITDPATRERLLIFGSIGLVTLLALVWAVFLRKRHRRHHSHHHGHHHSSSHAEISEAVKDEAAAAVPEERRRRRRSRRRHRPRNPTLAETGGLPPVRPEIPPESEL